MPFPRFIRWRWQDIPIIAKMIPYKEGYVHLSVDHILICAESHDILQATKEWLQGYKERKPHKYTKLHHIVAEHYVAKASYDRSLSGWYNIPLKGAYYSTEGWRELARKVKERDGNRCVLCNSRHRLQAHHKTYVRFGQEELDDLTTLCDECHRIVHSHIKIR